MQTPTLLYAAHDDKTLLALMATGDEKAFTEIYNRYWQKLFYIAGTKLRDLTIAEELVQDIFLYLWNKRTEIEITGDLDHYLAAAMKYKVINVHARIKKEEEYKSVQDKLSVVHDSTEQWLRFEELKEQLEKLVAGLPERCQLTYRLSREEGLSHKEIAEKLQISEKAVEGNIGRALKALRGGISQLLSSLFSSLPLFCVLFAIGFVGF